MADPLTATFETRFDSRNALVVIFLEVGVPAGSSTIMKRSSAVADVAAVRSVTFFEVAIL
jgi:hypothetical protein